jgi:hypothetical protein
MFQMPVFATRVAGLDCTPQHGRCLRRICVREQKPANEIHTGVRNICHIQRMPCDNIFQGYRGRVPSIECRRGTTPVRSAHQPFLIRSTSHFEESQMQLTSRFRVCALLILLSMLVTPASRAQTAVDGAVGGTVVDGSGSTLGGAKITVHENATNAEQVATADSAGYFRVIHLQPGSYSVNITASGFEPYRSVNVTVQVGLLTTIDARMQVGSTTQTVEVSGASPLVNTTNPDFAGIIDQSRQRLERLRPAQFPWAEHAVE